MRYSRRIHGVAPGLSMQDKGSSRHLASLPEFLGPSIKAHHVYTDNSKEFAKALDEMCVCHDTCTPYTPATNGKAERAVRRVKEGTGALLVQSGLSDKWWHKAMADFLLADGMFMTSYLAERQHTRCDMENRLTARS